MSSVIKSVVLVTLFLFTASISLASPPQSFTLRSANGAYAGRLQSYGNRVNIYSRSGQYMGRYQSYSNRINIYSRSGAYTGRINTRVRIGVR